MARAFAARLDKYVIEDLLKWDDKRNGDL
jgi:hypothetical protein